MSQPQDEQASCWANNILIAVPATNGIALRAVMPAMVRNDVQRNTFSLPDDLPVILKSAHDEVSAMDVFHWTKAGHDRPALTLVSVNVDAQQSAAAIGTHVMDIVSRHATVQTKLWLLVALPFAGEVGPHGPEVHASVAHTQRDAHTDKHNDMRSKDESDDRFHPLPSSFKLNDWLAQCLLQCAVIDNHHTTLWAVPCNEPIKTQDSDLRPIKSLQQAIKDEFGLELDLDVSESLKPVGQPRRVAINDLYL